MGERVGTREERDDSTADGMLVEVLSLIIDESRVGRRVKTGGGCASVLFLFRSKSKFDM